MGQELDSGKIWRELESGKMWREILAGNGGPRYKREPGSGKRGAEKMGHAEVPVGL
jgi:hypothetical protein